MKGNKIKFHDKIAFRDDSDLLQSILGTEIIGAGIHHWKFKLLEIAGTRNWKIAIEIADVSGIDNFQLQNNSILFDCIFF